MDKPFHLAIIVVICIYGTAIFAFLVFPLAGDWYWVEGWVFTGLFGAYIVFYMVKLNKHNPRVLRNRMQFRKEKKVEKQMEGQAGEQKSEQASRSDLFIFPLLLVGFVGVFVVSDLDHQFNWSGAFPLWLEVAGFALLAAGLYIMYLAQLQNAYASKVLDIREGQRVIDTGVYGRVRHPLYSGALGLVFGVSLGLGSWWALLPAVFGLLALVLRIKYEEEMLVAGLAGYAEYRERVKYKLVPKIF